MLNRKSCMNDYFIERERCPICDSSKLISLCCCSFRSKKLKGIVENWMNNWKPEYKGILNGQYELKLCSCCQLVFQKNVLRPELSKEFYQDCIPEKVTWENNFSFTAIPHIAQLASDIMLLLSFLGKNPYELQAYEYGMGKIGYACTCFRV